MWNSIKGFIIILYLLCLFEIMFLFFSTSQVLRHVQMEYFIVLMKVTNQQFFHPQGLEMVFVVSNLLIEVIENQNNNSNPFLTDCCDGSDEYTGLVQCGNNCMLVHYLLSVLKYVFFLIIPIYDMAY